MSLAHFRSRPLVILGAGYTGRFLFPLAMAQGWDTFATSRNPGMNLLHIPHDRQLAFDLVRPDTWESLPTNAHIIWCFPALPQEAASAFVQRHATDGGRLIILGSTSAYRPDPENVIDEQTPVNFALPRVQSEEYLRTRHGAMILRLAGLYGPGRHVLNWMRNGKVKHTERWVNLIHIDDVAAICLAALEKGKEGEMYLVSDGTPRRWSEIFSNARERWGLSIPLLSRPKDSGKRLSIQKLRSELHYTFRHSDLYPALDTIERERCGE